MYFSHRFGHMALWVLVLTVSVNSYGNALTAAVEVAETAAKAAKAAKAVEVARAGAIAAEAAKAVVVSGRVVGKLGTCVARQPKTVPKEAAEKSCLQQYEDCVKKDGHSAEGDKVNDRCVEVINKNISPK